MSLQPLPLVPFPPPPAAAAAALPPTPRATERQHGRSVEVLNVDDYCSVVRRIPDDGAPRQVILSINELGEASVSEVAAPLPPMPRETETPYGMFNGRLVEVLKIDDYYSVFRTRTSNDGSEVTERRKTPHLRSFTLRDVETKVVYTEEAPLSAIEIERPLAAPSVPNLMPNMELFADVFAQAAASRPSSPMSIARPSPRSIAGEREAARRQHARSPVGFAPVPLDFHLLTPAHGVGGGARLRVLELDSPHSERSSPARSAVTGSPSDEEPASPPRVEIVGVHRDPYSTPPGRVGYVKTTHPADGLD